MSEAEESVKKQNDQVHFVLTKLIKGLIMCIRKQ